MERTQQYDLLRKMLWEAFPDEDHFFLERFLPLGFVRIEAGHWVLRCEGVRKLIEAIKKGYH